MMQTRQLKYCNLLNQTFSQTVQSKFINQHLEIMDNWHDSEIIMFRIYKTLCCQVFTTLVGFVHASPPQNRNE